MSRLEIDAFFSKLLIDTSTQSKLKTVKMRQTVRTEERHEHPGVGVAKTGRWIPKGAIGIAAAVVLAACASRHDSETISKARALVDEAEGVAKQCPSPELGGAAMADIVAARLELDRGDTDSAASEMRDLTRKLDLCNAGARLVGSLQRQCVGEVRIGMDEGQVEKTKWCAPTSRNSTQTSGHLYEQWVYRASEHPLRGIDQPIGYLYFTDGVLTGIQRAE